MDRLLETTVPLQKSLIESADALAQRLNLTRSQLFAIAVENFIRQYQHQLAEGESTAEPIHTQRREFHQGDLYWVAVDEPGISHPCVIIQDDLFNRSRIHTLVVCALTTNLKRAKSPGNVLLEAGEGNLPRQSVVEVSKVSAVFKKQLGEQVGTLSAQRVEQILAGMRFLQSLTGRS